jgi:hypothetical protein
MSDQDLSHIFANSDMDEAQENHDALPHEMRMHMAMGFAHAAGLAPHPGKYTGPAAPNAEDVQGQQQMAQSEAISNLSQNDPPIIPDAAPKAKPNQSVGDAFKNWNPESGS